MSSFIKARVLQDKLNGMHDIDASIKSGISAEVELGTPALQEESGRFLVDKFGSGKCDPYALGHQ